MLYHRLSIVLFTIFVLYGCSSKPSPLIMSSDTYIGPPDNLLVYPCRSTPAGESLIELAMAYSKNNGCIAMWQKQMDKIKKNKKENEELYNVKPK